jgi:hypothetical protein
MRIRITYGVSERIVNPVRWIDVPRPGMRSPDGRVIPLGAIIEMEYGHKNQFVRAVRHCHFAVTDIALPVKSLPLGRAGTARYEIGEQSFFSDVLAHVVMHSVIQTYGLGFADILTALEIGRRFLRRRLFRQYVTIFNLHDRGQVCELVMGDDEGGFGLAIREIDFINKVYDKDVRFLTVRRLPP